jgi:hypothetical protein
MNDKNATQYELPTGAVAILNTILPMATWYKDEQKQARLIVDAVSADDALPATPPRPEQATGEKPEAYGVRVGTWGEPVLMFQWTERQKSAAKACVRYFLRNGNLAVNANTLALINLFNLDEE